MVSSYYTSAPASFWYRTGENAPISPGAGNAAIQKPASVTLAFTVQGPAQAFAMLTGRKLVENRSWGISPGWYALHVGMRRDSEWGLKASQICPDLPPEEELLDFFGAIVGVLLITEQRYVEECNGNPWAFGPICHVVSGSICLPQPCRYRGNPGLWLLPPDIQRRIMQGVVNGMTTMHDISILGPRPNRDPAALGDQDSGRSRHLNRKGKGKGKEIGKHGKGKGDKGWRKGKGMGEAPKDR